MKQVAKLVIVDEDNKYLLLYRNGHPTFGDDPDLPGGGIEEGEAPLEALIREVNEEAGIDIPKSKVKKIYEGTGYSKHGTHYTLYLTNFRDQPTITMSWEHSAYEWLDRKSFLEKAKNANDTFMHMVHDALETLPNDPGITGMPAKHQWYKNLDISLHGQPTGIDKIEGVLIDGTCYDIVSQGNIVEYVDMYENGQKIHYKKFGYDRDGRVIENTMYSPDGSGGWHIIDDIWYYEYNPKTGLRAKKIMKAPGASTAREILYDSQGNRTSEMTITEPK